MHQLQQSLDENINMSEIMSNTKKLQHRLTIDSYQLAINSLIDNSFQKDAARLLSLQGKRAGAWLSQSQCNTIF